jgi:large subunit ribosomal protein L1
MSKDNLDALLEQAEEKIEKGEELDSIESDHHGKAKPESTKKHDVAEEIKKAKMEANTSGENEEAQDSGVDQAEESGKESSVKDKAGEKSEKKKKAKKGKSRVRGAKYIKALELVERNKKYDVDEALELVKKTSLTKFDGNVEVHVRLLGKSGKPEQIRGMLQYPNSTGKQVKVVILDDKTIEEITKTQKIDADIYLTTPADMPKVAKLAKILGPKGKMPSPKSGTITEDPEKTKAELSGGKTEYKTDSYGIIHQIIGKVSMDSKALEENYKMLISVVPAEKIVSINLCATMGPGIRVSK